MRAAFFDVDGTLTATRVWQGLMDYFTTHRLRRATHLAYVSIHYPLYLIRRFGLISEAAFRRPWAAHLAWYMRGYSLSEAEEVWEWVVSEYVERYWRKDVFEILDRHRQGGDVVILVSGGPHPLLERIGARIGADHVIGTRFEVRDGRFTGRACEPICIDENKAILVKDYLQRSGINADLANSYAYADSISDLPLLEMVGHPVPVYPDRSLKALALERGWRVFPAEDNSRG